LGAVLRRARTARAEAREPFHLFEDFRHAIARALVAYQRAESGDSPVRQRCKIFLLDRAPGHATAAMFGLSGDSMVDWAAAKVPFL